MRVKRRDRCSLRPIRFDRDGIAWMIIRHCSFLWLCGPLKKSPERTKIIELMGPIQMGPNYLFGWDPNSDSVGWDPKNKKSEGTQRKNGTRHHPKKDTQ
jgi:hypothetical protein